MIVFYLYFLVNYNISYSYSELTTFNYKKVSTIKVRIYRGYTEGAGNRINQLIIDKV